MNAPLSLLGRIGLSLIFVISGWGKLAGFAPTQQYMEAMGVPGGLLPLVIALELVGGLAIVLGAGTRWIALALAGFSLATAALFHGNLADGGEAIHFWKNVGLAGGFLMLAAHGAGAWSLDQAWSQRRTGQPAASLASPHA